MRHAHIVKGLFVPKVASLPGAPLFRYDRRQVVGARIVRIEDEEFQFVAGRIKVDAEDGVRQDASACGWKTKKQI